MTLGSVGKVPSEQFAGERKLVLVPLVLAVHQAPDYLELVDRYWREVEQQVRGLESGLGSIVQVFYEGSVDEGDAALTALEKGNAPAFALIREVCSRGAQVRAIEEAETLLETLDLQRCLLVAQGSIKVAQRLYEWYVEARRQRYETMAKRIDEALEKGQVGLLVIGQEHQVQFPQDVRVFYVAPPALDAISRWLRDHPGPGVAPAGDTSASADGDEAEEGGGMRRDEPGESETAGAET